MGIGREGAVRRQFRTLFHIGTVGELTDGQLLERFATDGDEAAELAFAALVERHGPMVLRVCRGVLADTHAAQDAFQATFLVLVRRARGLWVRDSIGPWLYQVAYRTASCARTTAARHRRLERRAAIVESEDHPERDFELERLLHEEIDRLPERYRSPVVLCDLEGRSYEQAARHLGWPIGTVKSRLSRGRERLRDRLIRRGVADRAGPLAVVGLFQAPTLSIPPALLDATTAAAIGSAAPGSAVPLAQGVLRTMTMSQWWKVATVLVVAAATASGMEWLGGGNGPGAQAPAAQPGKAAPPVDIETQVAKPGKLRLAVTERGYVESARNADLYCWGERLLDDGVLETTTIIRIVPEGSAVKKGDVVAELDSAAVRDRLVNQMSRVRAADLGYKRARLARAVAEMALQEYKEGLLPQEQQAMREEIKDRRAAVNGAEGRLRRTQVAHRSVTDAIAAMGIAKTPSDIVAELEVRDRLEEAQQALDRQRRALAQAERKQNVEEKAAHDKTITEREHEIGRARAEEQARQSAFEQEKRQAEKLERRIASCTLTAPIDGLVDYANDPNRMFGINKAQIEEGATVRQRQKILSIYDPNGPMQINVKVRESLIAQIAPGMKARVKVDAFADQTFEGVVTEIAPLPDAATFHNAGLKTYTTRVQIGREHPNLRTRMTAEAEIVLDERDEAIGVPVGAVVAYDEKDHVAVKAPDGRIEWRDVVVGANVGLTVEIKEGLKGGELVILEPRLYLSDAQKARLDPPPDPARKNAARPKGKGRPARKPGGA
jgi:RND family efflux transporter MFP subunit